MQVVGLGHLGAVRQDLANLPCANEGTSTCSIHVYACALPNRHEIPKEALKKGNRPGAERRLQKGTPKHETLKPHTPHHILPCNLQTTISFKAIPNWELYC